MDDDGMPRDAAWVRPARAGDLAGAIVEYVRTYDYVSFPELQRRLEPYADVRGTWALELMPNLVLWVGMSEAFVDAFNEAKRRGPLVPVLVDPLAYLWDGAFLNLPVAKRPPKVGYKTEHWLPITLRIEAGDGMRSDSATAAE